MRLIDAYEFTEKCKEIIREENDNSVKITWAFAYDNFVDEINEQPTVDAVPVVRCKDCKHCVKAGTYELRLWCQGHGSPLRLTTADDYCSRGKRRDDNG